MIANSIQSPRRTPGFSLVELLIVVAIIALIVVLAAPAIVDQWCLRKTDAAKAAIQVCKVAISQFNVKNVTECLDKANKALKDLHDQNPDCFEKHRATLQKAADEINKEVDDWVKSQTEVSDEDKDKLDKAKVKLPPKD